MLKQLAKLLLLVVALSSFTSFAVPTTNSNSNWVINTSGIQTTGTHTVGNQYSPSSSDKLNKPSRTAVQLPKKNKEMGPQKITLLGAVKSPGIYSYDKNASIVDMIARAGGPKRFANINLIRISHLDGGVEEFNLELYSKNPDYQSLPKLLPGDVIYLPLRSVDQGNSWFASARSRSIQLIGAIARPGRYDWSPDSTILDALSNAGGPSSTADVENIKILPPPKNGIKQHPINFNLDLFMRQGGNVESLPHLSPGSIIAVKELLSNTLNDNSRGTWVRQAPPESIYIFGEVGSPGRYAFNISMGFLDIISAANGPTSNANISDIRVIHRDSLRPQVSKVDLGLFFKTGDPSLLPNIAPQDSIYIPSTQGNAWSTQNTNERVKILGAVARPDSYPFNEGMNVMDVIVEAGGPTADALFEHIVVIHPGASERQSINFDMADYAKTGNPKLLPTMRPGDIIFVPYITQGYWRQILDKINDVSNILIVLKVSGVI